MALPVDIWGTGMLVLGFSSEVDLVKLSLGFIPSPFSLGSVPYREKTTERITCKCYSNPSGDFGNYYHDPYLLPIQHLG